MEQNDAALFESFAFRSGIQVKNRVVMAPMTNWSANEDGTVSDAEIEYYARRSGGVGMIVTACTYVTPNGKGFPGEFACDSDDMISGLSRLAGAIKANGAKAVLQIFHGGRMCPPELVPNGDVVSASAVAAEKTPNVVPRALTENEIVSIIGDFGQATRRAIEAGYDGVEIHGANGYLFQQFFSPHSNRREDRWGGSLEKRMTFSLAVIDEVKKVVAEYAKRPFLVGYRFSVEEPETPGITMVDTLALVDALADQGLDYLHVSQLNFGSTPRRGGDADRPSIEQIREKAGDRVPVIGVGTIRTVDDALNALQTVPLVALGREIIMEPDWVEKAETGQKEEIETTLRKDAKERLQIPDPLWNKIMAAPGWFPVVE